jgi:hypothetical protein
MVLVMGSDLIEFGTQRSNARLTVDELTVAIGVIVQTSLIYDPGPDGIVGSPGQIEWQPRVVESGCPRILIKCPEHLPGFAEDPADAVE